MTSRDTCSDLRGRTGCGGATVARVSACPALAGLLNSVGYGVRVAWINVDHVFGTKGKLAAEPKIIVFVDGARLVVKDAEVAVRCSLANEDPHALEGNILFRIVDVYPEDQLHVITDLQVFSPLALRYPERVRCVRVVSLSVLEAPSVRVEIWLAHSGSLAPCGRSATIVLSRFKDGSMSLACGSRQSRRAANAAIPIALIWRSGKPRL